MRQTVPKPLRRLLRYRPSRRWLHREAGASEYDDSGSSEALVADGGARGETVEETHVTNVPDGAGCTEIWEHLSERRGGENDDDG